MLNKKTLIDLIEILPEYKAIQVRQATIIEEDNKELSRIYHRFVLEPGDDLTGQEDIIIKFANILWA